MAADIKICPYQDNDILAVVDLFRNAVQAINIQHYSQEQIAVWTDINIERWKKSLAQNIAFIAEIDGLIVGFADISHEGYLDRLYIHKDYQGRFVAVHLFRAIEKVARELGLSKITTDCSITARKPAERMGFVVVKEQTVVKNGMSFINYAMEKKLVAIKSI